MKFSPFWQQYQASTNMTFYWMSSTPQWNPTHISPSHFKCVQPLNETPLVSHSHFKCVQPLNETPLVSHSHFKCVQPLNETPLLSPSHLKCVQPLNETPLISPSHFKCVLPLKTETPLISPSHFNPFPCIEGGDVALSGLWWGWVICFERLSPLPRIKAGLRWLVLSSAGTKELDIKGA